MKFVESSALLSYEEIERIVNVLVLCGIRRVRITGGEPLVRRDLPLLISKIVSIQGVDEVVMTTNAHLLANYAGELAEAGLSGVNISLDSLDPERFSTITRGGDIARVMDGIAAARSEGLKVKLNAVAMAGINEEEIVDLVQFSLQEGVLLRFIEFMPIGQDTLWGKGKYLSAQSIREKIGKHYEMNPEGVRPGCGPASYWQLQGPGTPPGGGRIGIIAAVTECFCDGCNRIRLTSQGGLRACLADDRESNLRDIIRHGGSDEDLMNAVMKSLKGKDRTHQFALGEGSKTVTQMVSIGG
jgi:cyclic pyranopterin phosphate synthase